MTKVSKKKSDKKVNGGSMKTKSERKEEIEQHIHRIEGILAVLGLNNDKSLRSEYIQALNALEEELERINK